MLQGGASSALNTAGCQLRDLNHGVWWCDEVLDALGEGRFMKRGGKAAMGEFLVIL